MTVSIVFYSYSGVTKGVCEKLAAACGGDIIEVKAVKPYSTLTAYTAGCKRAIKGESDQITPDSIDVSASDLIVLGTPVWGSHPAPAVNGAVDALKGCEGKRAVLFSTSRADPKKTLEFFKEKAEKRGLNVIGTYSLVSASGKMSDAKTAPLFDAVKAALN